jgi:hypothetical protein
MKSPYELEMKEHDKHITWMTKNGGFAKDMTMRDHYAGLAMQILKEDIWNFDLLSTNAYELADAMLKAREGK